MPDIFVEISDENNEVSDNCQEPDEDAESEMEEDSSQDHRSSERENNEPCRGPGCPKIVRTGTPGRPRKVYQRNEAHANPKFPSEMMKREHDWPP